MEEPGRSFRPEPVQKVVAQGRSSRESHGPSAQNTSTSWHWLAEKSVKATLDFLSPIHEPRLRPSSLLEGCISRTLMSKK